VQPWKTSPFSGSRVNTQLVLDLKFFSQTISIFAMRKSLVSPGIHELLSKTDLSKRTFVRPRL